MLKYKKKCTTVERLAYSYLVTFDNPRDKQRYFYYGVQYGKTVNPKNLGDTYFSSNRKIKKFIADYGIECFTFEVRCVFPHQSTERILDIESRIIKRMKKLNPKKWINRLTRGTSNPYGSGPSNPSYGVESLYRASKWMHNPNTQEYERTRPDKIEDRLLEGWLFGQNEKFKKIKSESRKRYVARDDYVNPMKNNVEAAKKASETKIKGYAEGRIKATNKGKFGAEHTAYGSKHSEESKIQTSKALKEYYEINKHHAHGRVKPQEELDRLAESKRGRKLMISPDGSKRSYVSADKIQEHLNNGWNYSSNRQ